LRGPAFGFLEVYSGALPKRLRNIRMNAVPNCQPLLVAGTRGFDSAGSMGAKT